MTDTKKTYNLAALSREQRKSLLVSLWANAGCSQLNILIDVIAPAMRIADDKLEEAIDTYVDYFYCRPIKVDFTSIAATGFLYDRDAGLGQFDKIYRSVINN